MSELPFDYWLLSVRYDEREEEYFYYRVYDVSDKSEYNVSRSMIIALINSGKRVGYYFQYSKAKNKNSLYVAQLATHYDDQFYRTTLYSTFEAPLFDVFGRFDEGLQEPPVLALDEWDKK